MKKLLALVCGLVMCLSFAACGNDAAGGNDSSDASTTSTTSAKATAGSDLEKYIADNQEQIDTMKNAMGETGMNLDVAARGNSLVYSYRFTEDLGDTEIIKQALDATMDQQASTFETVLTQLKAEISSAESVIIEYLDKDGGVILSKEYK